MKKIISLLLIAALSATAVAYAAEATEDIMLISAEEGTEVPVSEDEGQLDSHAMFVKSTVGNAELYEEDGVEYVKGIDANDEEVHFVLDNVVIMAENGEAVELENGAQFTAFTAWDKPAPLVLPPVYYPDVIVIDTDADKLVDMDVYTKTEDTYTNAAGTLAITSEEDVDGKALVVIYGATTRSIPPIAVDPVIYLIEKEEAEEDAELETKPIVVTSVAAGDKNIEIVVKNDVEMLPVRAVAEALGLEVQWDNTLKAVTVGTVQMGVNFRVGENAYNKSKMAAFELSSAPVLEETAEGGVTYVPVDFFTEVLLCEATTAEGVMTLKFN